MGDRLFVEPLKPGHDLSAFDSGNDELDRWLRASAGMAQAKGTARTFIVHDGDRRVRGYFSLAPDCIASSGLPPKLAHGEPERLPAYLLAKLALDRSLQGKGLGGELLLTALEKVVEASDAVGGRYAVVDAIDENAAAFYEAHDFKRLPGADDGRTRLVRKMSDLQKALEPRQKQRRTTEAVDSLLGGQEGGASGPNLPGLLSTQPASLTFAYLDSLPAEQAARLVVQIRTQLGVAGPAPKPPRDPGIELL
jgi:GNAT superfamily N-acetyltransferase